MKYVRFISSVTLLVASLMTMPVWACTNLIVGKKASVDGSVICTCIGHPAEDMSPGNRLLFENGEEVLSEAIFHKLNIRIV